MCNFEDTARERWQQEGHKQALEQLNHKSDCAVYNEPAYPKGACDCGLLLSIKEQHSIVLDNYDADPMDCADGAVEEAVTEQFNRIKEWLKQ